MPRQRSWQSSRRLGPHGTRGLAALEGECGRPAKLPAPFDPSIRVSAARVICACKASHALDALLQGLGTVAEAASKELGKKATEEEIAKHAVKLSLGAAFLILRIVW